MAAQLLTRTHQTLTLTLASPSAALLALRRRRSTKVELIEIDLADDTSSSSSSNASSSSSSSSSAEDSDSDGGVEVMGMRRLEDAIHGVLVRRAAPDWLPFVPGSSYWVPPVKRPLAVVELFGRIATAAAAGGGSAAMTEEESLSFTTVRGWPSAAYFVEGRSPHPVKRRPWKDATQTDDEEN